MRASPQAGSVPLQVFGEIGLVDHGAVNHMAGHAGRVVHVLFAHHRLAAVGADHGHTPPLLAVLVGQGHAVGVLRDRLDAGVGKKFNFAGLHSAFEQRLVDVHPVDHRVRVAKALAESFTGFDLAHLISVDGVVHHYVVGEHRAAAGFVTHAQRVKSVKSIWPKLDAGTDFTNLGRLLKDLHLETLPHQRQRSRQTTNATTSDQDRQILLLVVHVLFSIKNQIKTNQYTDD